MKPSILMLSLFLSFFLFHFVSAGFFNPAELAAVYGGRIRTLAILPSPSSPNPNTTSILLTATESANSLHTMTISYLPTPSSTPSTQFSTIKNSSHTVISELSASQGRGYISYLGVLRNSSALGCVIVQLEGGVIYAYDASQFENGSLVSVVVDSEEFAAGGTTKRGYFVFENYVLWTDTENRLGFVKIFRNESGCFMDLDDSGVREILSGDDSDSDLRFSLAVSPVSRTLYAYVVSNSDSNSDSYLYVSPITIDSILEGTIPSTVGLLGLPESVSQASVFDIGPDGRMFLQGSAFGFAYSDNGGLTWVVVEGDNVPRFRAPNMAFSSIDHGGSGNYYVYCVSVVSDDRGLTWSGLGSSSQETHPNDGFVIVDTTENRNIPFVTTDAGVGFSVTNGADLADANSGLLAVQINDFGVTLDKEVAWTASKSGVRQAIHFGGVGGEESWYTHWPLGDGSTYYAIGVDVTNGDRVFAGNVRVYYSMDGGSSWSRVWQYEDPQWGFSGVNAASVRSIEIWPAFPQVVMIGLHVSMGVAARGTVLYSSDSGTSIQQIPSIVCNVNQLIISKNESVNGVCVAYVICEAEGIQKITFVESGGIIMDPVVSQEYVARRSDAVYVLLEDSDFRLNGLAQDSSGNLYGGGALLVDNPSRRGGSPGPGSEKMPIGYYFVKPRGAAAWLALLFNVTEGPDAGDADASRSVPLAMTVGHDNETNDLPIAASWTAMYLLDSDGWHYFSKVPRGTQVRVILWDDLVVGSGIGVYTQLFEGNVDPFIPKLNFLSLADLGLITQLNEDNFTTIVVISVIMFLYISYLLLNLVGSIICMRCRLDHPIPIAYYISNPEVSNPTSSPNVAPPPKGQLLILWEKFKDSNIWISSFLSSGIRPFHNRLQRATILVMMLFASMTQLALTYGTPGSENELQFLISAVVADVIVTPPVVIIGILFSKTRPYRFEKRYKVVREAPETCLRDCCGCLDRCVGCLSRTVLSCILRRIAVFGFSLVVGFTCLYFCVSAGVSVLILYYVDWMGTIGTSLVAAGSVVFYFVLFIFVFISAKKSREKTFEMNLPSRVCILLVGIVLIILSIVLGGILFGIFYALSWDLIILSVVEVGLLLNSLTFVACLLIIQLSGSNCCQRKSNAISDESISLEATKTVQDDPPMPKFFWFPFWFQFILYPLAWVWLAGASYILVIYGIKFVQEKGVGTDIRWLQSTGTSVLQNVFVMEPVKFLVKTVVITMMLRFLEDLLVRLLMREKAVAVEQGKLDLPSVFVSASAAPESEILHDEAEDT